MLHLRYPNRLKDVTSNKNELNELSKKVKAISTKRLRKDLINKFSIFNGAKYFSSGIFQNYSVFIPVRKYIEYFTGTTRIELWKSNGISEESIENITELDSNFATSLPFINHSSLIIDLHCTIGHHLLSDINFNGHCLIECNTV